MSANVSELRAVAAEGARARHRLLVPIRAQVVEGQDDHGGRGTVLGRWDQGEGHGKSGCDEDDEDAERAVRQAQWLERDLADLEQEPAHDGVHGRHSEHVPPLQLLEQAGLARVAAHKCSAGTLTAFEAFMPIRAILSVLDS